MAENNQILNYFVLKTRGCQISLFGLDNRIHILNLMPNIFKLDNIYLLVTCCNTRCNPEKCNPEAFLRLKININLC